MGGTAVRRPGIRVGDGDGTRTVALHITPLSGAGPGLICFLIVFEDASGTRPDPPATLLPFDEYDARGRSQHEPPAP